MNKEKITIAITPEVLRQVSECARSCGLSRSSYIEQVLRKSLKEVNINGKED